MRDPIHEMLEELRDELQKAMEATQAYRYELNKTAWQKMRQKIMEINCPKRMRCKLSLEDSLSKAQNLMWVFDFEHERPSIEQVEQIKEWLHKAYRIVDNQLMKLEDKKTN